MERKSEVRGQEVLLVVRAAKGSGEDALTK